MIVDRWKVTRDGNRIKAARNGRTLYATYNGQALTRTRADGSRIDSANWDSHLPSSVLQKITEAIAAGEI